MIDRVERPCTPSAEVFLSSLYTTNSSLPGWYSQRRRALVETDPVAELYWTSALANISGVMV